MARAVVKIEILFKKKTFFLNGLEKTKKPFFRKKSFFFWKSWKNSSRVAQVTAELVCSLAFGQQLVLFLAVF